MSESGPDELERSEPAETAVVTPGAAGIQPFEFSFSSRPIVYENRTFG